jgi:hypothetical protein
MRSSLLVCALVLLAACSKDSDDSDPGTDDSGQNDDSAADDSATGDDSSTSIIDADKDGFDSTEDCDDTNAEVNPDATEVCDEIDNNCVGGVDEGVTSPFYADGDGDTYGAGTAVERCSAPKGFVENADDCDDTTAAANPAGTEVCDGIDNNCADGIDEGVTSPFYADGDGDGYGAGTAMDACAPPTGYVENVDDCDDLDFAAHPGAAEVCDAIDNDCDSDIDDDDSGVTGTSTYYRDYDADGYGDMWTTTTACDAPSGYVDNDDDCSDYDALVYMVEFKYYDGDFDGYGEDPGYDVCTSWEGYVYVGGDCDNSDDTIYPGAIEVCDDEDNNCDSYIDGDDPAVVYDTWYADGDDDGYGDDSTATDTCDPRAGWVMTGGDCDDTEYLVSPGRNEYCDGVDNNCVGGVDETADYVDWYRDDDGDHYGQDGDVVNDCDPPTGYDLYGGDCDDDNATVHPGQEDVCGDDVDNECDGYVDNCNFDIDDAMFTLSGNVSGNQLGYSVGSGDIDGDGTDDLIVTAPYATTDTTYSHGAVYVVYGAASGDITASDVDATLTGSTSYEYLGSEVTAGDVDSDGYDDVLAAGAWSNKVFLFLGPTTSTTSASADVSFTTSTYGQFGETIALADLDGDPDLDTAIGEPYDWKTSSYGNVYIYSGPVSGAVSSPDLLVTGTTIYGYAGKVENVGDVDGDGLDDLAQGGFYAGSSSQGEVYLLDDPGSMTGTVTASSIAIATMTGDASGDNFGYRIAGGDYNDDGYDDLFVAATNTNDGVNWGLGRVYGWFGPVSGAYAGSSAAVTVSGELMYGNLGYDLALGDVSGDGAEDVVIGRPYGDTYVGTAYVLSGPATGAIDLGSMAMLGDPDGAEYSAYVGYAVGTIGDWSGDDVDDIIVGGWGMPYDLKTWSAGRTWVVASEDL